MSNPETTEDTREKNPSRTVRRMARPVALIALGGAVTFGACQLLIWKSKQGQEVYEQKEVLTLQIEQVARADGFELEDLPDRSSSYQMRCGQYGCHPIDVQNGLSTLKLLVDLDGKCSVPVEATATVNAADEIIDVSDYRLPSDVVDLSFENAKDFTELFGEAPCERIRTAF